MRLAYLVHDLGDAAVARRVAMLQRGGATVVVCGFHRDADPPATVAGVVPLPLGRTFDARLLQRASALARTATETRALARAIGPVDAILARNVELLALAALLRPALGRPRLVYEALDVHRLLSAPGLPGAAMRRLERRLAAGADLVLTSSPDFVTHHFHALAAPSIVVENKVLAGSLPPAPRPRPEGPPWRIGLFGALRCRRSVELLAAAATRAAGRLEVVIRGRPSSAVFPDLPALLGGNPHVTFAGAYRNPDDLPEIYGDVHFVWSIDWFEAGFNSEWQLPNRLYEGGAMNAVPLARAGTAVAAALRRLGTGVVLEGETAAALDHFIDRLDETAWRTLTGSAAAVPRENFVAGDAACRALVAAVAGPQPMQDAA